MNFSPVTQGTLIYKFLVDDLVDSGNMLIAYYSAEHILACFFTRASLGALFVKLR